MSRHSFDCPEECFEHCKVNNTPRTTETGWLVETTQVLPSSHACWWNGATWTTESSTALRFSRKQDAERYIATHLSTMSIDIVALEHMWIS